MTGPVLSTTVMVNEQLALLFELSVATYVTTCGPGARGSPILIFDEKTMFAPSQASVAVGLAQLATAKQPAPVFI